MPAAPRHDPPRCWGPLRVVYLRESNPTHSLLRVGHLCIGCHAFLPDAGYEAPTPSELAAGAG